MYVQPIEILNNNEKRLIAEELPFLYKKDSSQDLYILYRIKYRIRMNNTLFIITYKPSDIKISFI